MGAHAYLLLITGAILIAFMNVLTKKTLGAVWSKKEAYFTMIVMAFTGTILFFISWLTGGLQIQHGLPFHKSFWFAVVATGLLNVGIQYCNIKAKSLEDVSLVVPISASTPAIVILTCMIILGEYPSWIGWSGIWLLVIGTYILNLQGYVDKKRKKGDKVSLKDWFAPFLLLGKSAGVRWAFGSVFLSVFSLPYDGLSARTANVAFGLAVVCSMVAVGNLLLALWLREIDFGKVSEQLPLKMLGMIGVIALFWAMGGWLNASAYRLSIVPYVGTLKRIQIPFTIILAYFLIGEKTNFRNRLIGGSIIAAGAILIGISK